MLLYRPVGRFELEKIANLGFKGFPPRFETQPIFYPVLNEGYAVQIAKEWNTTDKTSGYVGYVTRFEVDDEYVSKFQRQVVGNQSHEELWVPSEQLEEFNAHIIGKIEVTQAFHSMGYIKSKFDETGGTPEEWPELVEFWKNSAWRFEQETKCHEHCDFCMATLCSEHIKLTGFDFTSGYSIRVVEDKHDYVYYLCPPCFEALQKEFELKLA